jgi:CTP:molybdopterin cytidylyltransferase MocA
VIAGILLASGASTRFGGDKLLASLDGRPVVRWSAEALIGAVDTLVVVVREDSDRSELRPEVRSAEGRSHHDTGPAELRPEVRSAEGRSHHDTGPAELRPEVRSAEGRSHHDTGPSELRPEVRSAEGRSHHESPIRRALEGLPVRWAINRDAEHGMSTAIRAGITALPANTDAAIVALADQPLVDAHVVAQLVARWREGGARAVQPRYDDGRGHPVLFDASLFPALCALEGDVGARAVLDSAGDALELLSVAGARPVDVDTPDALRAVAAELARRARG